MSRLRRRVGRGQSVKKRMEESGYRDVTVRKVCVNVTEMKSVEFKKISAKKKNLEKNKQNKTVNF